MSSTNDGTFKIAFYLIAGGTVSLISGLKRIRQLRKIEDTPCSDIRSAPQGMVEIEGHALPFKQPYENRRGKAVVYRDFKIEQKVSSGKNSHWKTVYSETEGTEFIVSDGTGLAHIEITGAELIIKENVHQWSSIPREEKLSLVSRYGSKVNGLPTGQESIFSFKRIFRVRERELLIGAPVYVRGSFQTVKERAPYVISPLHLRFLEKLAELKKQPGGRLKAFDLNRDGTIEEDELAKGSEKLLYQSKSAVEGEDKPERVAVQGVFRHESVHGLTVGDSHQHQLLRKLSSWNSLRVIGGAILIAAGAGLVVSLLK